MSSSRATRHLGRALRSWKEGCEQFRLSLSSCEALSGSQALSAHRDPPLQTRLLATRVQMGAAVHPMWTVLPRALDQARATCPCPWGTFPTFSAPFHPSKAGSSARVWGEERCSNCPHAQLFRMRSAPSWLKVQGDPQGLTASKASLRFLGKPGGKEHPSLPQQGACSWEICTKKADGIFVLHPLYSQSRPWGLAQRKFLVNTSWMTNCHPSPSPPLELDYHKHKWPACSWNGHVSPSLKPWHLQQLGWT